MDILGLVRIRLLIKQMELLGCPSDIIVIYNQIADTISKRLFGNLSATDRGELDDTGSKPK
mgnify:CR=1 FL=1